MLLGFLTGLLVGSDGTFVKPSKPKAPKLTQFILDDTLALGYNRKQRKNASQWGKRYFK